MCIVPCDVELLARQRNAEVLKKFLQSIVVENLEWIASSFCGVNCEDGVEIDIQLFEDSYFTMSSMNNEDYWRRLSKKIFKALL